MKYSHGFLLQVQRFEQEQDGVDRSDVGLAQFYSLESNGRVPSIPDPYYLRLLNGKKWFEWRINQIAETYGTRNWVGWFCLEQDYADDPGQVKIIKQRIAGGPISFDGIRDYA